MPGHSGIFFRIASHALLFALFLQAAIPVSAQSASNIPTDYAAKPPQPAPDPLSLAMGPTESDLRTAFSGTTLRKVDAAQFRRYVTRHPGQGRLLTGPALAAAVWKPATNVKPAPPQEYDPTLECKDIPVKRRKPCRDSVKAMLEAKTDSIRTEYGLGMGDSIIVRQILNDEWNRAQRPPVRPPPPFSFKDSIPDLDTVYDAPSQSMHEAEKRRDHRKLVSRYYRYRDSVRVDSMARHSLRRDSLQSDSLRRVEARDSLLRNAGRKEHRQDTLVLGEKRDRRAKADRTDYEDERSRGWFLNFYADLTDGDGGGGGGGMDAGEWAAVIYVVVGVVVVGAFVLYGVQTIFELATNQEENPLFMDAGVRFSYSGHPLRDPSGNADLYRDSYLAGLRFAIGVDRPGMDLGLAMEGGYINVELNGISDPARSFAFQGGYLVAGPMLRFGDYEPFAFSLEFLNGTSTHQSIGWISKSRMALTGRVGPRTLLGGHLGAVFYDLQFLDGLGWRDGNFNRDLSLVYGLDIGWEL